MKPLSGSADTRRTRTRCPTSIPLAAIRSFPSTGGCRNRTHVPSAFTPDTTASKCAPIGPLLFFQEAFQTLRGGVFRQIASEGGGQLHNPVPSMRCLNDTLDTRRTFRVQECSRGLIGGDHEVLDQQARTILPPGLQIHDFAVGQDRLQFGRMERERARIVSSLTK